MLLELVTVDLDLNLGFFLPEPSVMVLIHSIFLPLPRHGLRPSRFLCPLLSPEVCLNSCPLSLWFCLTILSSTTSFSSCLQSVPASGSFPMNRLFTLGGQSIRASASASVLPMNIQSWFPLRLTGWSPCTPRDSKESSPAPQSESINSSALSLLNGSTLNICTELLEKP